MGKPKMTALAIAIKAAEPLSDEEKQTLRDILRPAPKPRQKGKSRARTRQILCVVGNCFLPANDTIHQPTTDSYHPFRGPAGTAAVHTERKPSQKRKAGKEAQSIAMRCGKCNENFDHNIHHVNTWHDYHEFVEPASEASKGVGA